MKIDDKKLTDLHIYFAKEKGSTEPKDVLKRLETDDQSIMDAYVDALREKYPTVYPPKKQEAKAETKYSVVLITEDGIAEELEFVSIKGNQIYARKIIPRDLVTVKIGGKDVQIDLLNVKPTDGLSVETLTMLGKIAKGE